MGIYVNSRSYYKPYTTREISTLESFTSTLHENNFHEIPNQQDEFNKDSIHKAHERLLHRKSEAMSGGGHPLSYMC